MRLVAYSIALALVACSDHPPAPSGAVRTAARAPEDDVPRLHGLDGFWSAQRAQTILDRMGRFDVSADRSALGQGERDAVDRLMEAGDVMQRLYERSRHPQAVA